MTDDKKPTPDGSHEPKLLVDPEALGEAFVRGLEEAAKQEAELPKAFEAGEGMPWPLSD
jgi:hypothetical protein